MSNMRDIHIFNHPLRVFQMTSKSEKRCGGQSVVAAVGDRQQDAAAVGPLHLPRHHTRQPQPTP